MVVVVRIDCQLEGHGAVASLFGKIQLRSLYHPRFRCLFGCHGEPITAIGLALAHLIVYGDEYWRNNVYRIGYGAVIAQGSRINDRLRSGLREGEPLPCDRQCIVTNGGINAVGHIRNHVKCHGHGAVTSVYIG